MEIRRSLRFCNCLKSSGLSRSQQNAVFKPDSFAYPAVWQSCPAKKLRSRWSTFVQQNAHQTRASLSCLHSSKTWTASSRLMVENPSRKSSSESPFSIYSKKVCTGMRVPRNTGAPCITSGSRVTASCMFPLSLRSSTCELCCLLLTFPRHSTQSPLHAASAAQVQLNCRAG